MSAPPWRLLRRALAEPFARPAWPPGVRPVAFDPARDAEAAWALLFDAYRDGGGHVAPFASWWNAVRGDAAFDPALLMPAADDDGRLVAVALCWRDAFLKDLAVSRGWRRRRVGEAMLLHVFATFEARGAAGVDLKVEIDNPSGAERLYRRMGFRPA